MENPERPRLLSLERIKNSLTIKLILLGIVFLLLLIPLSMTGIQRRARFLRADEAEREVSAKWGGRQTVTAPVLHYKLNRTVESKNGPVEKHSTLNVLPEKLEITGTIVPELRYRGIYPVLLYRARIEFKGEFAPAPAFERALKTGWTPEPPTLQFGLSDIKGITGFRFDFAGRELKLIPGCALSSHGGHCEIPSGTFGKDPIKFDGRLELNGCRQLLFQPVGRDFALKLDSTWLHPSFTGGFLPVNRTITDRGFCAEWKINEVNRTYPQFWFAREHSLDDDNLLGVALVQKNNAYRQIERVDDYAVLIIAIVLAAFLVGEKVAKIWIHPLQYLVAGLSLVMFYLLLLALSEHIGFGISYLVSTAAVTALCAGYALAIFGGKRTPALLLGGVVALAYALIYLLVRMEDYALLAGSVILLGILALGMKLTGHMNSKCE